ncbi:hypothetical protein K2P47_01030 [Patescibacteria group bacterium]|nr:hypothetical protein [Patescibacteria group bacterium]
MMTTKSIHYALRRAKALGPKGEETLRLKEVLAGEGVRLNQLHHIYVNKKGAKKRPLPYMVLLIEEVIGEVREYFSIVISFDYVVLEQKHPHKDSAALSSMTQFIEENFVK